MATDYRTGAEIVARHECWELLRSTDVGRLAVAAAAQPDIFPINFVVDHGSIVFRTAEGTKLAAAVLGRGVAFEVDGYDRQRQDAWSVVVKGRAVEIFGLHDLFDASDLPLFPWMTFPKPRFVRIEPESVTGRRFGVAADGADRQLNAMHRGAPEPGPTDETTFDVLTEADCRRLLAEQEVGRVAFVNDCWPVVLPVNYVLDGNSIAIRTGLGAKTDGIPLKHVAFEVDGLERWSHSGWSVLVQGFGQDVTDALNERYEDLRRRGIETWPPGDKGRWLAIDIHRISGRRIVPGPNVSTSIRDDIEGEIFDGG